MTIEAETPAGVEAPTEAQAETPVTTEVAPASTTAAKEAPTTQEPDYDSLLAREDFVDRVLAHPKAQQRIKSVRDADVERRAEQRATQLASEKAEALLKQRDAQYAATRDRENRVQNLQRELDAINEDPTSPLAQLRRPQLEAELKQYADQDAEERAAGRLAPKLRQDILRDAGNYWLDMLGAQVQADESLTDEERRGLDPRDPKFATPDEFFKAWKKLSSTNEAKRLAKEFAKPEAEAIVAQRLGEARSKQAAPAALPAGTTSQDDSAFLADYAAGKNSDHTRARKLMGL